MSQATHEHTFRVRYSETDQMGTFYNARALEWFEVGRTEAMRAMGLAYTQWEARGVMLPLVEARLKFEGRAVYDDELRTRTTVAFDGRARLRFDARISHAGDGRPVVSGHTIHAITNAEGRPIRPPTWLTELLSAGG